MQHISSSGDVAVALHHLAEAPDASPMLISHATGFHAHCYRTIADALDVDCWGLDYRGHGESPVDPEWEVDWAAFGDDATAVAGHLFAERGQLVGFGHSMGGAALLMAAHHRPELFSRLVLFEPISHEATGPMLTDDEMRALPIVQGAMRRRRSFPSVDEAYDNYAAKPPMSMMHPEVLRDYVTHGFAPTADGQTVELRCSPEIEAGIFMTGRANGVWQLLPEIDTPCLVISGMVEERQPSASTERIANRLPNGEYLRLDHQTHFGPFSHPHEMASIITAAVSAR